MTSLLSDLRLTARQLRKTPGFTIVAVLTLALGIGANALVFGVLNTFILHPLNVPQSESLYGIGRGADHAPPQSYLDYLDLLRRNRSFDGLAAYSIAPAGLDTGDEPSRVWLEHVSGNYFDVLRIHPQLGRFFHGSDEHGPNSAPYIVLTHAYWHSHFDGDPCVVGRVVRLNKYPFTILGVAPPEFHGTMMAFNPDFFVPMVNEEQIYGFKWLDARGNRQVVEVMGHLKPGVTPAQATADLNAIGADLEESYPKEDARSTFVLTRTGLFGDTGGKPIRAFLTGLMLLAALILVAVCANLGSLFAARAAERSREVALRLALGSSRWRILRQHFTEATLIALMGGAVGIAGSVVLMRALSTWHPIPQFPIHVEVSPDANVFLVAILLALVSGLLFGAVPARQAFRINPYAMVKSGSAGAVGRRLFMHDILLVVQVAICALLVTSSMVAVRGLVRSLHSNFGFVPKNVLLVNTSMNMAGYSGDHVPAMQKRMIDAVAALPGVETVGLINVVPLASPFPSSDVFTDNTTDLTPQKVAAQAGFYRISPEYFSAAGTALLSGRTLSWNDSKDAPPVAVVNREFSRRIFGSVENAVGRFYKMPNGTRTQVVGVVEDGKYASLTEDPKPAMFLSFLQSPSDYNYLVVRTDREPQQLGEAVRGTLHQLDPGLPALIETWNGELDDALFASRVATVALGMLGVIGAVLALTGIFGMAAYAVSKRLREFGIRVAIGAHGTDVLWTALGRAIKLLAIGSAAGLALGVLASRVLAAIVYQATPRDPFVLAGVVLAMALLGLIATWLPAQRALSVNPVDLLREE